MLGGAWSRSAALTVTFLLVLAAVLHKDDVRTAAAALPHRFTRGTAALQPEWRHLVASHAAVSPLTPTQTSYPSIIIPPIPQQRTPAAPQWSFRWRRATQMGTSRQCPLLG
jgi:hypothetical protein